MGGEMMEISVLVVDPDGDQRLETQQVPDDWFPEQPAFTQESK